MTDNENASNSLDKNNENKTKKESELENEQEDEDDNMNMNEEKNNNKDEDPYIKYITHIEQLQNELELEKSITNSLKNYGTAGEELIKLKTELQDKEQKLLQLQQTHRKQEEALNELRKKISKEIPKSNKSYSQNNYKKSNINNNNVTGNEAVNIVLKIKDRELNDALQKMNTLKKENQALKNELYKNDDYSKKLEIADSSKENNEKIKQLNFELKILNKQLMEHNTCVEEQTKMNKEYIELKNKLKELKSNTNENKIKIKEIESPTRMNTESADKNLLGNKILSNKKKKNYLLQSEKKISNVSSILGSRNNNIVLPPISTPRVTKNNNNNSNQSILTNDFIERVKNYFDNKKDEFETLIFKINEIENSRTTIENKHKSELNQFNKQITSLDEQFQILNSNGKSINSSIRVLKNKLNIIKGEAKTVSKKFSELKKEFESLEGVSKEKDYEISLLLGQINSLKNLANINDEVMPEDEIDLYIDKLKNNQNMQKRQSEKSNMSYKKLSRNEPNRATEKNVINSYDYKKSIKKFKTINTGEKRKGYDFIDDVIDNGNKDKKTVI